MRTAILSLSLPLLLAVGCLFSVSAPVYAQQTPAVTRALLKQEAGEQRVEAEKAQADIRERVAELKKKLEVNQEQLRNAEAVQKSGVLQPGRKPEEQIERIALLRRLASHLQRHLDLLARVQLLLEQTERDRQIESTSSLSEEPPYSIDQVDGLWAEVQAKSAEIQSAENSLRLNQTLLEEQQDQLDQAQQELRKAKERVEEGRQEQAVPERINWLRDLAELRNQTARAGLAVLEEERSLLRLSAAQHRRTLSLLRAQAAAATLSSPLSKVDRDAKLAAIADKRGALKETLHQASRDLQEAQDAVQVASQQLAQARAAVTEERAADEQVKQQLAALQFRLDSHLAIAETARFELDTLRLLDESLVLEEQVWHERYRLAHNATFKALSRAQELVREYQQKILLDREKFQSRMTSAFALIESQRQQIAGMESGDPNLTLARMVQGSFEKRMDFYRWFLARGEEFQGLLGRWREEIELYGGAMTFSEMVRGFGNASAEWLEKVWNFELFTAQDTMEVDGETVTGKRSITVSKVVTALVVLVAGLWITGRLARGLRWLLVKRSRMDEGGAILAQRLVYITCVFILVFFALTFFKIPVTVFAFLGGALAIATGFGAQNLINNFISGLILLIERPVKLGDIVEVEGVRGTVTSIGMRFSELKRFDGVDILIPNSILLEKQVINWTLSDQTVRVQVTVYLAHGAPIRDVIRLLQHAVNDHGNIHKHPRPQVLFEEFGESSLVFNVYFWVTINSYMDYKIISSDVRVHIERLLREAGIAIAYPHLDVTLAVPEALRVSPQGSGSGPFSQ